MRCYTGDHGFGWDGSSLWKPCKQQKTGKQHFSRWSAQRWNLCLMMHLSTSKSQAILKIYISPSNISSTARCSSRKRSWASSATRSSARAKRSFSCGHDGYAQVKTSGKGYWWGKDGTLKLLQNAHLGHGSNMTFLKWVKLICKCIGPEMLLNIYWISRFQSQMGCMSTTSISEKIISNSFYMKSGANPALPIACFDQLPNLTAVSAGLPPSVPGTTRLLIFGISPGEIWKCGCQWWLGMRTWDLVWFISNFHN